jgi:hypothetical protein
MNLEMDIGKPESLFVLRKGVEVPIESDLNFHKLESNSLRLQVRRVLVSGCTSNRATSAQPTANCSTTRNGCPTESPDHLISIIPASIIPYLHNITVVPLHTTTVIPPHNITMILSYNWQIL